MQFEKKISGFQFELKDAGDVMTLTGYGSTFGGDPDCYGDIVQKGAFVNSLKTIGLPKMLYQHDTTRIAGVWTNASEDSKGLLLEGKFINTDLSQQAREECLAGALDSMSIGFSPVQVTYDDKADTRTLQKVDLYEVSLVTFPANANALITNVKSLPETEREFERFLREAGYSREQAITIAKRGFKALDDQREAEPEPTAEPDLTPIYDSLIAFTNSIKDITHA